MRITQAVFFPLILFVYTGSLIKLHATPSLDTEKKTLSKIDEEYAKIVKEIEKEMNACSSGHYTKEQAFIFWLMSSIDQKKTKLMHKVLDYLETKSNTNAQPNEQSVLIKLYDTLLCKLLYSHNIIP